MNLIDRDLLVRGMLSVRCTTNMAHLLIHDEKFSQPVKIICLSLALKIVIEVAHVGSIANICDVSFSGSVERELTQYALVTFARGTEKAFRDVTVLDGFGDSVDIH